jgi:ribose transport system permease protein
MWWLLVLAIAVWYMLMHTKFGVELEAIGSNERAAKLVGIRVQRSIFLTFILSSLLAGVAGVLLTIRNGNGDPAAGPSFLFGALAAVFLGATTIRPGRYNVWGAMIGVFVVAIAVNGFTLLGAAAWLTPVFNGLALVGAVTVSTLMGRRRLAAKTGATAALAVTDQTGAVDETQPTS